VASWTYTQDSWNSKQIKQQASEQSKIELKLGVVMAATTRTAARPSELGLVAAKPYAPTASTRNTRHGTSDGWPSEAVHCASCERGSALAMATERKAITVLYLVHVWLNHVVRDVEQSKVERMVKMIWFLAARRRRVAWRSARWQCHRGGDAWGEAR
jgi:hypothetical protein